MDIGSKTPKNGVANVKISAQALEKLDFDKDGTVTEAELNLGLKRDIVTFSQGVVVSKQDTKPAQQGVADGQPAQAPAVTKTQYITERLQQLNQIIARERDYLEAHPWGNSTPGNPARRKAKETLEDAEEERQSLIAQLGQVN